MALLALAPNNPASGPSGNGWDYPASYGGSKNICFIRFRVVGDVVGYTTTTDGTFIANNEDQSNNEGYSCYSSGQKEDLWESFEDIIELANVLITIPIPGWAAVAAFCGTVSALNAFADRSLGNDFLFWPDREASLQWSYDTQAYYLTYLAPEAAKAISYFDWTVPKTSGNYRITVYAEIGYGHLLWQQNYYRYVLIQDGTMNTYNYIRVII